MNQRTHAQGPSSLVADDIRDHGFAILQTRVERIPRLVKGLPCQEPEGCDQPATLATLAIAEATIDGDSIGFILAKAPDGNPECIVTCEAHRCEASHDLYRDLTGRLRPDGIRAFDALGKYLNWT